MKKVLTKIFSKIFFEIFFFKHPNNSFVLKKILPNKNPRKKNFSLNKKKFNTFQENNFS